MKENNSTGADVTSEARASVLRYGKRDYVFRNKCAERWNERLLRETLIYRESREAIYRERLYRESLKKKKKLSLCHHSAHGLGNMCMLRDGKRDFFFLRDSHI